MERLIHHRRLALAVDVAVFFAHIRAVYDKVAALGQVKPCQQGQERTLATARFACDCVDLTGLKSTGGILYGVYRLIFRPVTVRYLFECDFFHVIFLLS